MQFIGGFLICLTLLGGGLIAFLWFRSKQRGGRSIGGVSSYGAGPSHQAATSVTAASFAPPKPRDAAAEVREAKQRFIHVGGEPKQVTGTAMFLELQAFGPDKRNKVHISPGGERLREFRAIRLGGSGLLVEHPRAEGGGLQFFLYEDKTDDIPPGFTESLKGTEGSPGPAKRFAMSNQSAEVYFEVLGKKWRCQDIMWLDVDQIDGRFFVRRSSSGMPRLAGLLGKCGEEWCLFLQLHSGEGSHTLWVGRKFDPEGEIDV